jgi:hypothetical protein
LAQAAFKRHGLMLFIPGIIRIGYLLGFSVPSQKLAFLLAKLAVDAFLRDGFEFFPKGGAYLFL